MKARNLRVLNNELYLGNHRLVDFAKKYKTPLYVFDEYHLDENLQMFKRAFKSMNFSTQIVYASKAFLVPYLLEKLQKLDYYIDAVSIGDLYIMNHYLFDMSHVVFHGNNKLNEELEFAVEKNVGLIVVDNEDELKRLDEIAHRLKKPVSTLFRVNPGVNCKTHKYIQTAKIVSKFGESIYDLTKIKTIIELYKKSSYLTLCGFHAHIGSQIMDINPYFDEIEKMIKFQKEISLIYDLQLPTINFGGGFGVNYTYQDKEINLKELLELMILKIENVLEENNIKIKNIMIEPGRSIVADPGFTLYTCGTTKETLGGVKYQFIDGGMTDNIRPALYQATYEVDIVNKINDIKNSQYNVVGKCCESGDVIRENALLPITNIGDILIVYTTGAYNYSMFSNYNNMTKPAVIFVGSDVKVVSKREELQDLIRYF